MATIDLTLDALKIPNINGTFPFGTKITQTELNHGGLSTTEVNSNVMLPFTQMRPKICDEDSDTSQVEYDAKVVFNAPQGTTPAAGYTLTMGNGTYVGCTVTYTNLMEYACTVKQSDGTTTLFSVPAGKTMSAMWNGTAWLWTTTGSVTANDPTPVSSAAVHAAIGDAIECGTTSTVKASMKNLITGNSGPQQNCYLIKFPNKKALAIIDLESYEVPTQTISHYQVNLTGGTIIRHIMVEGWQASNASAGVTYCDSISDFWINNLSTANGKARCRCMVLLQLP